MKKEVKDHAISTLRRGSYRWKGRWEAERRSRVGRGEYYCEECGTIGKKNHSQMDHTIPVVDPVEGWKDFDTFIERLYIPADGWKRLCKPCHLDKTRIENSVRKEQKIKTFSKKKKSKKKA